MSPLNSSFTVMRFREAHGAMFSRFLDLSLILVFYPILNFTRESDSFISALLDNHNWNEALNVMSYHRNKMNEYLCRNYFAKEIIQTYQNESIKMKNGTFENKLKNSRLARESLLTDPGSQNYKNWLSRSSTLEDIYRQFEHLDGDHAAKHETGEGHEGEVTGYALVGHKNVYSKPEEFGDLDSYGYYKDHKEEEEGEEEDEYDEKGLKLKELFHFALTAIAFLAFACFMIEVIICFMETPQSVEPDYVLVPTSTGGTGHASKLELDDPEIHRHERSLDIDPMSIEILNSMSSKILSSIEALTILYEDNGQCFQRALCQNSKYSKTLPRTQKMWLPLWNLGMSWISRKVSKEKGSNTLKYLKATVAGLGSQDCHSIYPCNGRKRRKK